MDSKMLITGTITLVILLFIMGAGEFYSWLSLTLLSYLASALFVVPIAYAIIKRELTKKTAYMIDIGAVIFAVYILITGKTPYDALLDLLKTIVVISLLGALVETIKKYV